jgi:D-amino-acid dehydrogenase
MQVLVMGAGVVGVAAAYYLQKDGHDVVVLDRQPQAANETSFANAGMIAPGHSYTWASPRAPKILLQSLFKEGQALKFRLRFDPAMWAWCLKFLKNCTAEAARLNTSRKVRLCLYSQARLDEVVADTGVKYDRLKTGAIYLYRDRDHFERGIAGTKVLADGGVDLRPVDPDGFVALEPALAQAKDKFVGGIHVPTDESGDANLFTRGVADVLATRQVRFKYDTAIEAIDSENGRITGVRTSAGVLKADHYVVAMGSYSAGIAKPLGLNLPIYPIKGYSLTYPIESSHKPPSMCGVDEHALIGFARFGNRLRVTAQADFAGFDWSHTPNDFAPMAKVTRELFPNGADYDRPKYWAGLRPMTPEGTPIIGRSPLHSNLWFDTGHGHIGWTMSCGSGRILADLIAGREPALDLIGMRPGET